MRTLAGLLLIVALVITATAEAAAPAKPQPARRPTKPKPAALAPEKIGLFQALASNRLAVSFVPRDASVARVSLMNGSDKPLAVSLPRVFAGVPVAVLANVQPATSQSLVSTTGPDSPQILGSVFTSFGMEAAQPQADAVVLQPRQIRQFAVPCVCLQYGNPTPSPAVAYRLVSLDSVSQSAPLGELLTEFSYGRLDQPVVQLAAWHFSNNLSWDQLAETGFATHRLPEAERLSELIETSVQKQPGGSSAYKGNMSQSSVSEPAVQAPPLPAKRPPRTQKKSS